MRYNIKYLEEMQHVPNLGSIIEQIDQAAGRAAVDMRAHGETLPSSIPMELNDVPKQVPLKSDIDTYLRFLVADAYIGFMETKDEAEREGSITVSSRGAIFPEHEIEGLPSQDDPMFEVSITGLQGAPAGFLLVRISRRLTG